MPIIAQQFVKLFDGFGIIPKLRLLLPAFEFTISIPDEVVEQLNIDEVSKLIKANKKAKSFYNYQLVNAGYPNP